MKFIFVTVPIRPKPDFFPPVGVTSLFGTLAGLGYDPILYDVDGVRHSFDQVVDYFRREQPDIVGISAVVSTAYGYVKRLSRAIRSVSGSTRIILGGCLAASSEILLRKCPIDICVIGEGEVPLVNLVRHWEKYRDFDPHRKELAAIKGIAYIDSNNDFIFTGYQEQLPPDALPQPDYEILRKYSNIDVYLRDPLVFPGFRHDARTLQAKRLGQKCCVVLTAKGCVSRCTFCHRWVKGYRVYPVDNVIATIKNLQDKYNAGFFFIGDECFGADPDMLDRFIKGVRPSDILFSIGGMRMATVYRDPGVVRRLKDAGCVEMSFGMESGSDKILSVMEKGATAKQNLEVAKLLAKEGMPTIHQLVIGMPGESGQTIKETTASLKSILEDAPFFPVMSINYFQSLPGTPAYEFMRTKGLIGQTLDDEEAYLLKISNVNAGDSKHYINVSEEPISKVLLWQHRIRVEVAIHWYKFRDWRAFKDPDTVRDNNASEPYFARAWHSVNSTRAYFRAVSLLGESFWSLMLFMLRLRLYGIRKALLFSLGIRPEEDRSAFVIREAKSLRQMPVYPDAANLSLSETNMLVLRKAR